MWLSCLVRFSCSGAFCHVSFGRFTNGSRGEASSHLIPHNHKTSYLPTVCVDCMCDYVTCDYWCGTLNQFVILCSSDAASEWNLDPKNKLKTPAPGQRKYKKNKVGTSPHETENI